MRFQVTLEGKIIRETHLDIDQDDNIALDHLLQYIGQVSASHFDTYVSTLKKNYALDFLSIDQIKHLFELNFSDDKISDGYIPNTLYLIKEDDRFRRSFFLTNKENLKIDVDRPYQYYFKPNSSYIEDRAYIQGQNLALLPQVWNKHKELPFSLKITLHDQVCIDFPQFQTKSLYNYLEKFIQDELSFNIFFEHFFSQNIPYHTFSLLSSDSNREHIALQVSPEITLHLETKDLSKDLRLLYFLSLAETAAEVALILDQLKKTEQWTLKNEQLYVTWAISNQQAYLLEHLHHKSSLNHYQTQSTEISDIAITHKSIESWKNVILSAKEFLIISSYIIEDLELTQLIRRKSLELPGKVIVLCNVKGDFLEEFRNLDNISKTIQFRESKKRQLDCLQILLNSPLLMYHSSKVHLKCCLSEKQSLISSANLTPNSLRKNIESYYRSNNIQTIIQLYHLISNHLKKDGVLVYAKQYNKPIQPWTKGILDSLITFSQYKDFISNPNLISNNHNQPGKGISYHLSQSFYKVLKRDLNDAKIIYALNYNFHHKSLLNQVNNRAKVHIAAANDKCLSKNTNIIFKELRNCHAKLILINNSVIYIGTSDSPNGNSDIFDITMRLPNENDLFSINKNISNLINYLKAYF